MKKLTLLMLGLCTIILLSCGGNDRKEMPSPNDNQAITSVLEKWKAIVVSAGRFSPADSCSSDYFTSHPLDAGLHEGLGLPVSDKFIFVYADINNDSIQDALVTFHPVCCTCHDTSGVVVPQIQVLILSDRKEGYQWNDTYFNSFFRDSSDVKFDIDSASVNELYGTYFKIGKQDTSIEQFQKSIRIDFASKEVQIIKRK